jgi:predicted site-specific integrase-resolvase
VDTARILRSMTKTRTRTEAKYVSRYHAAKALGVSLRTVKRYMDAGKLDYVRDERTGRVWIVNKSLKEAVGLRTDK